MTLPNRYFAVLLSVAAVCVALLAPASSQAANPIVQDCLRNDSLTHKYSDSALRAALKQVRGDIDEYSDCRALISGAIGGGGKPKAGAASLGGGLKSTGGKSGGNKGGSRQSQDSSGASGEKGNAAKSRARHEVAQRNTERALGDRNIDPRKTGVFEQADSSNGLPLPVLLGLIALAIALAGGSFLAIKRRPEMLDALKRVRLPGRRG